MGLFSDNVGENNLKTQQQQNNEEESTSVKKMSNQQFDEWLLNNPELSDDNQTLCALIYGKDGTGKSGIVLDFLTDDDIKAGKKALIIDLDGGNIPLIKKHHKKRVESLGKKLSDVFIIRNPLSQKIIVAEDGEKEVVVDYKATFGNIVRIVNRIAEKIDEWNIKFVVFDGLSTALKHAERQMRIDKHIAADGGIQLRYWLVRNKIFEEVLEQIKSLPCSKFFIAHDDFIVLNEDSPDISSVKRKTNAMVHQKIRCVREVIGNKTIFKAIVDKSKYNTAVEGTKIVFCEVDNQEKKMMFWDTAKIWNELF